jgi:Fe-S cluster biogenesis protein NfuA
MDKKKNNNIEEKIIEVLERIKPYLENDGGNLEYIKFEEGIVYIKLLGACAGCSMIDITLKDGIEAMLMDEVPEVLGVERVE